MFQNISCVVEVRLLDGCIVLYAITCPAINCPDTAVTDREADAIAITYTCISFAMRVIKFNS